MNPRASGYEVRRWGVEEGLPDDQTTKLAQTPDGWLRVGTSRGLAMFDGKQFLRQTGAVERVASEIIGSDSHGRLWVRDRSGQVAYVQGAAVHTVRQEGSDGCCEGIAEGPKGTVWFHGQGRIFRYHNDRLERLDSLAPAGSISSIAAGLDQKLWVTRNDELLLASADGFQKQPLVAPETEAAPVIGPVFRRGDGSVGVVTKIGLFVAEQDGWRLHHRFEEWLQHQLRDVKDCVADEDGNVWLIEDGRLLVSLAHGTSHWVNLAADLSAARCEDLLGDSEGNVWVATESGLYRIRRTPFRRWTEGLLSGRILGLTEDDNGRIWVVSSGGVQFLDPGSTTLQTVRLDASNAVEFVTPGPGGAVWFSSRAGWVWRWTAGEVRALGWIDPAASLQLEFFGFLPSGRLLASGAGQEAYLWNGTRFVSFEVPAVSATVGSVTCFAEDSRGRLYAAFNRELFRLEAGKWQRLIDENQSSGMGLARLFIDAEDGVWISLWPGGLARWSDSAGFQPLGQASGIPEIVHATFDKREGLWLNTAVNGVARVDLPSARDWLARERGEIRIDGFDHDDGLGTLAGSGYFGGALTARDGRVWVATAKGLCVIDPAWWEERRRRSPAAQVQVELVSPSGGSPPSPGEERAPVFAPHGREVEFRYAAVSLTRPDRTRFKHRLRGFDEDWVESGPDQVARYSRLAPGQYEFEVMAANAFNQWGPNRTRLTLKVGQVWWRSPWFLAVGATLTSALIALGWAGWRRRSRGEADSERSRRMILAGGVDRHQLAAELRDRLGQRLLVAKNMALMGLNTNTANPDTARQFREISDAITDALGQSRALAGAIDPVGFNGASSLAQALRALVERVAKSAGIEGQAQLDNIDGLFKPAEALQFYDLAELSLTELLKQQRPARLILSVRKEPDRICLVAEGSPGESVVGRSAREEPGSPAANRSELEERVRMLGGQMHRETSADGAVAFRFSFVRTEARPGPPQRCSK